MQVSEFVGRLEQLVDPRLAASWDNVGLLLQGNRPVKRVLLTIDLSLAVVAEVCERDVDVVVAYHPTIFGGLKSITHQVAYGAELLTLLRRGCSLYCPHTALDAMAGGVNDWMLLPLGEVAEVVPVEANSADPTCGFGRIARLVKPVSVAELIAPLKRHFGTPYLRIAGSASRTVRSVAVCPGSGGSVFRKVDADLLVTGEMSHHEVLAAVARGCTVLLSEHTHTERGYLRSFRTQLLSVLDGVDVVVSARDTDPISLV